MDWKNVISKIAPTVASALGGPLAGGVVAAIGEIVGISEPTQDKIKEAIENGALTGQQIADIRMLEMKLKGEEQERGFRYSELEFKDRDSARNMQVQTHSRVPEILTYLLTIGFFGVLFAMFRYPEIKESAPLMIMLGSLGTAWTSSCAFWFGTTFNSNNKTFALMGQGKQ